MPQRCGVRGSVFSDRCGNESPTSVLQCQFHGWLPGSPSLAPRSRSVCLRTGRRTRLVLHQPGDTVGELDLATRARRLGCGFHQNCRREDVAARHAHARGRVLRCGFFPVDANQLPARRFATTTPYGAPGLPALPARPAATGLLAEGLHHLCQHGSALGPIIRSSASSTANGLVAHQRPRRTAHAWPGRASVAGARRRSPCRRLYRAHQRQKIVLARRLQPALPARRRCRNGPRWRAYA